jgi:hypothetical protein
MKSTAIHLRLGFPIVLDGPYTKDCQEHHDWEDRDIVRRVMADKGSSEVPLWMLLVGSLVVGVVATIAAFALSTAAVYLSHIDWSAYIADMGQALQALGQVGGAKQ